MRGKLVATVTKNGSDGITPACAGKTARQKIRWSGWEDHPRVCGENVFASSPHQPHRGSPPRVRGKLPISTNGAFYSRITPACAGKTWGEIKHMRWGEDHPRVCGENRCVAESHPGSEGSPPRVRGKLRTSASVISLARITPACAGKTTV